VRRRSGGILKRSSRRSLQGAHKLERRPCKRQQCDSGDQQRCEAFGKASISTHLSNSFWPYALERYPTFSRAPIGRTVRCGARMAGKPPSSKESPGAELDGPAARAFPILLGKSPTMP
jgi:hypothetical protein